jgi:2-amino-4-hydroxy-6-hydroxymethyldihydropteridine diphosphokinase
LSVFAVIALGGNLGDPKANILGALKQIENHAQIQLLRSSGLVESFAVTSSGVDKAQPNYLNAVAEIATDLTPHELLSALNLIEDQFGRVRTERWASRTLDIDIITFGDERIDSDDLVIPHPRAQQRAFVLVPWAQMDAEANLPGFGLVRELAAPLASEVWQHAAD